MRQLSRRQFVGTLATSIAGAAQAVRGQTRGAAPGRGTAATPVAPNAAASTDWPQFLGPLRNGTYMGPPLTEGWGASGPAVVWRKPIGQGFAGAAVSQNRAIVFHRVGNEEVVEALDVKTGASTWRYAYPTKYRDDFGFDEGPRAVPVVAGGRIYTFGAEGQLHAIDAAKGTRVWSDDTMTRFRVAKGYFGAGGSPLVEGGQVIANVGGDKAGIVAFDAATGKSLWTATSDAASYSSGVGATFGGRRVAIFLTREGIVGIEPMSGQVVFQQRWRARMAASVNAATPLVVDDLLFISAQYGPGAGVFRIGGVPPAPMQLTPLWASDEALSNHYATSVHHDGHLYGYHGRQEFGPSLRCVELRTGKVKWSEEQFRAGSIVLAGTRLVVLRENGELILAPASPAGFRPAARAQVLTGVVRPYPAIADGVLYARNENTMVALDLRRG
jgi:outer membrane protein assembly factor BamB